MSTIRRKRSQIVCLRQGVREAEDELDWIGANVEMVCA